MVASNGFGHGLHKLCIHGCHTLDGGVVQANGPRLAAKFAQFAQLIDHTHDYSPRTLPAPRTQREAGQHDVFRAWRAL